MPVKNKKTAMEQALLSLLEKMDKAAETEDDEEVTNAKKRKQKSKGKPPASKYVAMDSSDPKYDEEIHGVRSQSVVLCFLCWHVGHRALTRDHVLPRDWPPKLRD